MAWRSTLPPFRHYTEPTEVGSSNGLLNRSDRKASRSMRLGSAIAPLAQRFVHPVGIGKV